MHFLFPISMLLVYVLIKPLIALLNTNVLSSSSLTQYIWLVVLLHTIWVMNIADLYRLNKFHQLGRFATRWFEKSLNLEELETYSSAGILIISWFPFLLVSPALFFLVSSISTVSDALASILGKSMPIFRFKWNEKSLSGYCAGFVSTFLLVLSTNLIFPFNLIDWVSLPFFALCLSIMFVIVDLFSRNISDNFLNTLILGVVAVLLLK